MCPVWLHPGAAHRQDEANEDLHAPWENLRGRIYTDANPCGTSRNAFANLLANVWYPTMNVSSTTSASEKCFRSCSTHASVTSWSSRVTRSAYSSAALSRAENRSLCR